MILAMGTVLVLWAITVAACQGWAFLLLRLTGRELASLAGGFQLFWIGFAVQLGLLQIWHLFWPVDWLATAVLLGGGLAIWGTLGLKRTWSSASLGPSGFMALALLGLWLANRGLDIANNYDSGLYHFATIRWINEYPVVPGLANLVESLGFNQSFFLFVALLNIHPYFDQGYHAANSLLVFVLSAQLLRAAWSMMRAPSRADMPGVLQSLLLPVVVAEGLGRNISSPSPDLSVAVCGIVAFVSLVETLAAPVARTRALSPSSAVLIALGIAACTLKLSFVVFGCAILVVALWPGGKAKPLAAWIAVAICTTALGVPYAIHGYFLSGYPAFPMAFSPWPADWRLPAADARDTANWIYSWARQPGQHWRDVLGTWSWLGPWWARTSVMPQVFIPLTLAGAGTVLFAVSIALRPAKLPELTWWWRPHIPLLAGLLAWFFTAPDPRFADWIMFLTAAWSLACALWPNRRVLDFSITRALAMATVAAALGVVAIGPSMWPGTRDHGFAGIPQPRTKEFVTDSGLKILIPADDSDRRLWGAPLPSAQVPKPQVELRGTSLREGFRTRP